MQIIILAIDFPGNVLSIMTCLTQLMISIIEINLGRIECGEINNNGAILRIYVFKIHFLKTFSN